MFARVSRVAWPMPASARAIAGKRICASAFVKVDHLPETRLIDKIEAGDARRRDHPFVEPARRSATNSSL